MKKISIKARIMVWLTLLLALLAVLFIMLMLAVSSEVAVQTAMDQLSFTVKSSLEQIHIVHGKLELESTFRFYQNGVSTLIYSKGETLLAGQIPVSFSVREPFENGMIRMADDGEVRCLVLDLWLAKDWENGVWVRGLMQMPDNGIAARNMLKAAVAVLPVFLVLAAAGSYGITRRAFRPLDSINATAAAINEARDLSRRIGLPAGQDEFSKLAGTFDHLFERLEQLFEAEKQFASDASHELRTPVSIIKGACEYAQKYDETEEDRQETIAMIYRQAVRMSDIISQLLNMTRLEQGTEQVHMETVELCGFLCRLCREQNYDPKHVAVLHSDRTRVQANPKLLERLVINLVENGLRYGKKDAHVFLSAENTGKEVLLKVRDDGIGIASEHQEKIWQRFYQADPSRSGETGAGLGLPMVQQIARVHGGYMTLESIPGSGSTFTLHLPCI